jgi:putative transposase
MNLRYKGHRFPPEIISYSAWLYYGITLILRDVENLRAERGITVSCKAIRFRCLKFGPDYARRLRKNQGRLGDNWSVDEVFITNHGKHHDLWRAVDQDRDVIDVWVPKGSGRRAAKRFFRKALKHQGQVLWQLVTDKLRGYSAAHQEVLPSVIHRTGQYENNPGEASHQHTREQECQRRRFKSIEQAQRLLSVLSQLRNLFHVARNHLKAVHHRLLRKPAFSDWREVTCAH